MFNATPEQITAANKANVEAMMNACSRSTSIW
jgi:hypothetical protein